MATIIIELPDEQATQLEKEALRRNMTREEIAQQSIREFLESADRSGETSLNRAIDHVLDKNQELYRRLS